MMTAPSSDRNPRGWDVETCDCNVPGSGCVSPSVNALVAEIVAAAMVSTAVAACGALVLRRRARRRWLESLSPRERAVEIAFEYGRWVTKRQQRLRRRPANNSDGDGTLGENWTTIGS